MAQRQFTDLRTRYRRQCGRADGTRMRLLKRVAEWLNRQLALLKGQGFALMDDVEFDVCVEPSDLSIGIQFFLKAKYRRGRGSRPHRKDLRRAQDSYDILLPLQGALSRVTGLPVFMDVTVD